MTYHESGFERIISVSWPGSYLYIGIKVAEYDWAFHEFNDYDWWARIHLHLFNPSGILFQGPLILGTPYEEGDVFSVRDAEDVEVFAITHEHIVRTEHPKLTMNRVTEVDQQSAVLEPLCNQTFGCKTTGSISLFKRFRSQVELTNEPASLAVLRGESLLQRYRLTGALCYTSGCDTPDHATNPECIRIYRGGALCSGTGGSGNDVF